MKARTILDVSEDRASAQLLKSLLCERDYDVLSIPASQVLSFLFLLREVKLVVLDVRGANDPNVALAREIKSLRPDAEIIVIASRVVDPIPACVDAWFCWAEQMNALTELIARLLEAHAVAA